MPRRRSGLVRKGIPVAAAVLVLAGGSIAYAVTSSGSGNRYITTAVTRADVQQLLNLTGSVQQVKQQAQTFHASAPIASVSVAVGDTVKAGQVLATLDPATLKSAVLDAKATLAAAKAKVETDQTASTSSSTSTSISSSSSTSTASSTAQTRSVAASATPSATASRSAATPATSATPASGGKPAGGTPLADAQRAVTTDLKAATAALTAATAACTTSSPTASATPSDSATPSATSSASASPSISSTSATPSASPTTGSGQPSCLAALQNVQSAQQKTATDQQTLAVLLSKQATAGAGSTGGQSATGGTTRATGTGSSGSGSSAKAAGSGSSGKSTTTGQSSSTGSTATGSGGSGSAATTGDSASTTGGSGGGQGTTTAAGQLLIDQAAVGSAEVALADAETDLASATLRASISGTVASVGLVKGTTASSSSSIVIVGTGAAQVTVDIPLTNIRKVNVGQVSYVTPDGSTTAVAATVQSIGLLPVTTTGSASYPVVVLVPAAAQALSTGSRAQVSIVLSTAAKVLTVPNSALTSTGTGTATVTILAGGKTSRLSVKTGTIGTVSTEVTSGLSLGEQVVLADNSRSLPANSATVTTGRFGAGGGTGGPGGGTGGGQPPTGGGFGGPAG